MKKTFVILSFFVFLIGCTSVNSGKESEKTAVIPQPVSVTEGSGEFTVTPGMKVYAVAEAEKAAEFLTACRERKRSVYAGRQCRQCSDCGRRCGGIFLRVPNAEAAAAGGNLRRNGAGGRFMDGACGLD